MKRSLIMFLFLIVGLSSVNAIEVVPRIGVDLVRQQYVYQDDKNKPITIDTGLGISLGVVLVGKKVFLDVSVKSASTNTLVNDVNTYAKGWRSELALTGGYNIAQYFWLTVGVQQIAYGASTFGSDRGTITSPFVGFSMNNMQQDDYLFSFGFSFARGAKVSKITGISDPASSQGGLRLNWRKKGSPHLFAWEHRINALPLEATQDIVSKFSYSYLFL